MKNLNKFKELHQLPIGYIEKNKMGAQIWFLSSTFKTSSLLV